MCEHTDTCFSFRRPELKLLATNHSGTKPSESLTSSPGPLQAVPMTGGGHVAPAGQRPPSDGCLLAMPEAWKRNTTN